MTRENEELIVQRGKFDEYIKAELVKRNSSLISNCEVEEIRKYLKDNNTPISSAVKKRIIRNKFTLMTYSGCDDVLCSVKTVS